MGALGSPFTAMRSARARSAERAAAACLLVMTARDEPLDAAAARRLARKVSAQTIVELATFHRIAGLGYERLQGVAGLPTDLLAGLGAHHATAVELHAATIRLLATLQPVLELTGVPWAVLKGPVAAELLYGTSGRRDYRDLDVVVDPRGFADALTALEDAGARVLDPWSLLRRHLPGQLHVLLPDGGAFDLHWALISTSGDAMRIDTHEVLGRAERVDVLGTTLPTLDPTDSALHLAAEAAMSGGERLGWLKDLERSAAVRTPDWREVADRARRWNVERPVGLMLSRAAMTLGADVPPLVIRQLLGRRTAGVVLALDRRWPPERASGGPTPGGVLARVLSRRLAHDAMRLVQRGTPFVRWGTPICSAQSAHDMDAERTAFLRAVARSTNASR